MGRAIRGNAPRKGCSPERRCSLERGNPQTNLGSWGREDLHLCLPPSVHRTRRLDCRGGGKVSTACPAKSLDVSLPSRASAWACLIVLWSSRRPGAKPPTHPVNRETEPWGRAWPGLQTGGNSWG